MKQLPILAPVKRPIFLTVLLGLSLLLLSSLPARADDPPPPNPKLDSVLAQLVAPGKLSTQDLADLAQRHSLRLLDERVQVQVVTQPVSLEAVKAMVAQTGGEVTGIAYDQTVLQSWLPVAALAAVAAENEVLLVRRPLPVFPLEALGVGSSTTEGLGVINGPAWHSAGYTGSGVKVGIIDLGYVGYQGLLGTDLPTTVTVKNFTDGETDDQLASTTEHGTACAEVIHDLAPGAALYLAKVGTDVDLAEAVAWLISQQVDIISSSIGLYNATPGDGSGFLANLVSQARSAGILWTTAAGNDRVSHWGGVYRNTDSDKFHEFANGDDVNCFTFTLIGGSDCSPIFLAIPEFFNIFVRWSDWSQVNQDFDVHLVRFDGSTWQTVASSTNVQNGQPGQTPTEWVSIQAPIFDAAPYGFRIERKSGTKPVNFEVFTPGLISLGFGLRESLTARSLANLADSPEAVTVAALNVSSPYAQEFYSSEGPTNGPGGSETGGLSKPDLAGFANVSTQTYGAGVFNGTSSATPHVAGAAALVLSAYPSFTPNQLESFLTEQAVDMGPAGVDTQFGFGRLALGEPPPGAPSPPTLLTYYLPVVVKTGP
jgi:subtilisin family serine protease